MTVKEIAEILKEKGFRLKGCTANEIAEIESYFKVQLPNAYTDFLKTMGRGAGDYLKGSSVFYDEIFDLKDGAVDLLTENNFKPLPEDAFVFYMHQGYQFAFFLSETSDDPPVFYFYEGKNKSDFEMKEKKFTDFLEVHLGFL